MLGVLWLMVGLVSGGHRENEGCDSRVTMTAGRMERVPGSRLRSFYTSSHHCKPLGLLLAPIL